MKLIVAKPADVRVRAVVRQRDIPYGVITVIPDHTIRDIPYYVIRDMPYYIIRGIPYYIISETKKGVDGGRGRGLFTQMRKLVNKYISVDIDTMDHVLALSTALPAPRQSHRALSAPFA